MNELRTRRMGAVAAVAIATLVLAVSFVGLSSPAIGAQKLGTLISEADFDWMAGSWVTTTDQGDVIEVTYKWAANKHVVIVEYKASSGFTYHGLIFYKATENKIVHVGADNLGGVWEGTWDSDGRRAMMKFENARADGQIRRGAAANSRVDANTMKVEMYLVQNGQETDEPLATITYKRKKPTQKTGK